MKNEMSIYENRFQNTSEKGNKEIRYLSYILALI